MEGLRRSGRGIIIGTNKPRRSPAYIGCARHHPSERYPSKLETNISIGCFAMLQGRLPVVCAFRFPIPSSNSKSSAIYILGVYFFYLISVCHCFSVRRCFINFLNDGIYYSGFCSSLYDRGGRLIMSASACGLCRCLRLLYRTHVQTVCHGHAGGGLANSRLPCAGPPGARGPQRPAQRPLVSVGPPQACTYPAQEAPSVCLSD